jgi:hypothetical protein
MGLEKYAGRYDPRVDVRLRLGLPIKTCKECGIPFPDYHPRRIYCSQRCNQAAWRARIECGTKYRGKRRHMLQGMQYTALAALGDLLRPVPPGHQARREMRYEPS